jgi:lysophospholipase L1-like esterase
MTFHRRSFIACFAFPGILAACDARPATGSSSATVDVPAPPASAPVATAARADEAASAAPAKRLHGKVVCFGDSITQADWAGVIAPEDRWVTQLGTKSADITVVNAGKNGRTTTSGLAELDAVLDASADAAVFVVFLGVNDMKHASVGVVEKATANMARILDGIREKVPAARIVLAAPIGINEAKLTPFFRGEGLGPDTVHFMKALAVAYRSLAAKKHVDFVDLLDVVAPEDIPDGVHANGRGQRRIAEAVYLELARE